MPPTLTTDRLMLRRWREADREPLARLNADPEVMRHFVAPLTWDESDALVDRIERDFDVHGFGLWAVERREDAKLLGFTGLAVHTFPAPFTPCVEVGWRLDAEAWGRGYATEAAREAIRFGFEEAGLPEIVSFTSPLNEPSIRVMQRLGMERDPRGDFEHPRVPEGHPLRPHVLYRLRRDAYLTSRPGRATSR